MYTDASKINKNVGVAIICAENTITYKSLPQCSIYSVEAFVVIKALEFALNWVFHNFTILIDSLSTMTSIELSSKNFRLIRCTKVSPRLSTSITFSLLNFFEILFKQIMIQLRGHLCYNYFKTKFVKLKIKLLKLLI